MAHDARDAFQGCLLGLAIGDALGYPHEFRSVKQVRAEIGPEGITDFLELQDPRFSRPFFVGWSPPAGTYTDDTQMTLAVAEGLLEAGAGASLDDAMNAIGRHFVAWSKSDDNNRSPGGTCMTGCEQLAKGVAWREAGVADSKGCGSAMRVAPIGLWFDDLDTVEAWGRASSLLTHGHDAGLEGAAACALMVAMATKGADAQTMHEEIARRCGGKSADFDAVWAKVPAFVGRDPQEVLVNGALGESWVAEEAAASALWCAWQHPDDYAACVRTAINTEGDSDSIGCIAGSIVGARVGRSGLPATWVERVENSEGLIAIADRLVDERG
jgi:ADP-ribosylglycohydrolase